MFDLPAAPGSYALHLFLPAQVRLSVGRLGMIDFPTGSYFYLGSAHGPGGLRARLKHHSQITQHPHWHIDWLRPHARLVGGWFALDSHVSLLSLECAWSQALVQMPDAWLPAAHFGSSDCRSGCGSHMVAFTHPPGLSEVEELLRLRAGTCKAFIIE